MKRIYKWALNRALEDGGIMPSGFTINLEYALECMDNSKCERFIEILIGCDVKLSDLRPVVVVDGKEYTLKSFNYLNDDITYTSIDDQVRYFSSPEAAQKYHETGNYKYSESNNSKSTDYPFEGIYTSECAHWTDLRQWLEWSKIQS